MIGLFLPVLVSCPPTLLLAPTFPSPFCDSRRERQHTASVLALECSSSGQCCSSAPPPPKRQRKRSPLSTVEHREVVYILGGGGAGGEKPRVAWDDRQDGVAKKAPIATIATIG